MNFNPFSRIWRADPVAIAIPAQSPDPLAALRSRVTRWGVTALGRTACVGAVTPTRVRIHRQRPFSQNGFAPVLDATLIIDREGAKLEGVYRTSWYGRLFLTYWFGFLLVLLPGFVWAGVTGLRETGEPENALFLVGPPLMLAFGGLLLHFGQRTWEDDKRFLESFITTSLRGAHDAAV